MSEKRGLKAAALKALFGRATVAVVSLLFVAYLARDLPKSTLGLIALHAIFVMFSKVVLEFGLSFAVLREATPLVKAGQSQEAVDHVIGAALWVRGLAALVFAGAYGAGLALLAPRLLDVFVGVDLRFVAPFAATHLFLKNFQFVLSPIFFARDSFGLDSALDSGAALLEKIFAVTLYLSVGIDHFFLGMVIGQVLTLVVALFMLRDVVLRVRLRHLMRGGGMMWLRRYWPLYQRTFFRQGMRQVDRLLIAAMVSAESLALLHVARQASTYLRYIARAFVDPLTVRLAEAGDAEHRRKLVRTAQRVLFVVPLVVMLAAPLLMRAVGGEAYADGWPLLALLTASYVFYGLSEVQLAIVSMMGTGRESVRMDAISGVVGLVATAACVSFLGDLGMAFGQLTSFFVLYLGGRAIARQVWGDGAGAASSSEGDVA